MGHDAIVLGAGQNGLAAAARLAGAGRRVVVLERRDAAGGLCAAREFHPGHRAPGVLHDDGLVDPAVAGRLGLERHGLAWRAAPPVLLAEADGPGLLLAGAHEAAAAELGRRAPADAAAWVELCAWLARLAPTVRRLLAGPPPRLAPEGLGDLWRLARPALALRRLGRADLTELLRVAPMCVADFLNERFATPLLVEGLAAPALAGAWAGPWSAGTTTFWLLQACAAGRFVAGGPAALAAALERAARAAGAEIRTGAEVARIRVEGGRVAGVVLASGERLDAPVVVATSDPKRTLLELVAPGVLPLDVEEEARRIRSRGTAAKIHVALDGPLELAGRPGERLEAIRIGGGHVDELERAFDAIKYREASSPPHLEVRVPTVADPGLAPAGHEVVSILASFAPCELAGGWTEAARARFLDSALARLERHAPGVRSRIVAAELLVPPDLEAAFGTTGGQLHQVEPALDQLYVLRPSPSTSRYVTPLPGLVLGGAGSHPGGGVRPTPGLLAADAVLAGANRR
jgi:phytoene dehydrogenase-like protein